MAGDTFNDSLIISQQPGQISPAYRPIIFKVTSLATAAELQVMGTLKARNDLTKPLETIAVKMESRYLGNSYFLFDFSNILQSLLSFDRYTTEAFAVKTPTPNSIVEYVVEFAEVYNDANGFPRVYDQAVSSTLKATNSTRQHEEVQNLQRYIIMGQILKSFSNDFNASFGGSIK